MADTGTQIYRIDEALLGAAKALLIVTVCVFAPLVLLILPVTSEAFEQGVALRAPEEDVMLLPGVGKTAAFTAQPPAALVAADPELEAVRLELVRAGERKAPRFQYVVLPKQLSFTLALTPELTFRDPTAVLMPEFLTGVPEAIALLKERHPGYAPTRGALVPPQAFGAAVGRTFDLYMAHYGKALFFAVALLMIAGACASAGLLHWAGLQVRRRETRILAIWGALHDALEVSLTRLVYETGFAAKDVLRSVQKINELGQASYVFDEKSGTLHDRRLGTEVATVERCVACGAKTDRKMSLLLAQVPDCDYCKAPFPLERWNEMKLQRLAEIRGAEARRGPRAVLAAAAKPFRVGLFVILMVVFWPAALVYALRRAL